MSSIVYYKFLHQKKRLVIHFDGTLISVFDLKREIIIQNNLGTGKDFNLKLYHSELPEVEYELDQDSVPRSSYVLVKRSPANTRGPYRFNNATRYVTGAPRVTKRFGPSAVGGGGAPVRQGTPAAEADGTISEEDKIKLMFQNQSDAWAQTQDELAQHKMIHYKPPPGGVALPNDGIPVLPQDIPPPGYMCYRCGKKDHWIKNCPTNTDPTYEGKKILRSTGIPKSYLQKLSRDELEERYKTLGVNENGDMIDQEGNAILLTEEGDYAIAVADSKTWSQYQQKQQNASLKAKQEFENKLIELIEKDNKPEFLNPLSDVKSILKNPIVTTSCCKDRSSLKNLTNIYYNQSEIESILISNDFVCPNCGTEDVYIDSLIRNEEIEKELAEYIKLKESEIGVENPNKRPHEGEGESDAKRMNVQPQFPFMPMPLPSGMPVPPPMFMPPPFK